MHYQRRRDADRPATASPASRAAQLLGILHERCDELGVKLEFRREIEADETRELSRENDLVVACDGVNSKVASGTPSHFGTTFDARQVQVHLARHARVVRRVHVHLRRERSTACSKCTRIASTRSTSTFIVECDEELVEAAGLDTMRPRRAIAYLEKLFAKHLDGEKLLAEQIGRGSSSSTVRNETWRARQRRAARRRRAHGALLDRLGHEARDGRRHRARDSARRTDPTSSRTRSRATKRSGARSSSARSAPPQGSQRVVREREALHASVDRSSSRSTC